MAQTVQECLDYLESAREAVTELSVIEDRSSQLELDERRFKDALDAEKKLVADMIQTTVKKRRGEMSASYDTEIGKAQEHLKKVRAEREKARNRGVKERIDEETSELHEYNKELSVRMKEMFCEQHVPVLCRTRLYYSLYIPRWAKEVLTLLLFAAVVFVGLPYGVYLMIPNHRTLYLAGLYLADLIIFGGIYMIIGNHTKMKYAEVLREGRQILDQIYANNKKIKVITSTIRKDRNESLYNLEKYDDEITCLQQELNNMALKKREALNTFESVTKNILQDEIEHSHKDKIDKLQRRYDDVREQLQKTAVQLKEKRLEVADRYGSHLGREFLDLFKIKELITIIESGRASNISEAIEEHQKKS